MPPLSTVGLVLIAVAALSGWVLEAYHRSPEAFERVGIRNYTPLRQTHIDWILMALLLFSIDQVVPDRPAWMTVMIAFGAIVNPLLFLPLAVGPRFLKGRLHTAVMLSSFASLSIALPALAIHALT